MKSCDDDRAKMPMMPVRAQDSWEKNLRLPRSKANDRAILAIKNNTCPSINIQSFKCIHLYSNVYCVRETERSARLFFLESVSSSFEFTSQNHSNRTIHPPWAKEETTLSTRRTFSSVALCVVQTVVTTPMPIAVDAVER